MIVFDRMKAHRVKNSAVSCLQVTAITVTREEVKDAMGMVCVAAR